MPADTTGYPPEFAALLDNYNQEVTALMTRLEAGKVTTVAWTEEMQRLLSRYSQAARMLGMGEVKLLPAEVDAVRAWLNEQFKYLDGFETVINSAGGEYDPAWLPRAQMYGASTVTEYWEGKTSGLPLPAQPGQGSQCLSNCRCHWDIQWIDKQAGSADCFWVLNPTVENCQTCQTRAEMWNPVKIRGGDLEGTSTPAPIPAPKPTRPVTPKPPKVSGPSGIPVSNAFTLPTGKAGKFTKRTLDIIDSVHGDGNLDNIPIVANSGRAVTGKYRRMGGSGKPIEIVVSKVGDNPMNTVAHEIGHFIDHQGLGKNNIYFGTDDNPLLQDWYNSVGKSDAYKNLISMRKAGKITARDVNSMYTAGFRDYTLEVDKSYIDYLMTPKELWARSYAQYIAEKSKDPEMLAELDVIRKETYPSQWDSKDFKPILDAMDILMEKMGWRK